MCRLGRRETLSPALGGRDQGVPATQPPPPHCSPGASCAVLPRRAARCWRAGERRGEAGETRCFRKNVCLLAKKKNESGR
jgi:hypothetical protein